jgi:hypothetical protein
LAITTEVLFKSLERACYGVAIESSIQSHINRSKTYTVAIIQRGHVDVKCVTKLCNNFAFQLLFGIRSMEHVDKKPKLASKEDSSKQGMLQYY